MYKVKVNFEEEDKKSVVIEVQSGHSVLEGILLNELHLNHNCGGVCGCSTCHIYVHTGDEHMDEISDAEEDFIDRAINPRIESRLACQCILADRKEDTDIEVTIPDQSKILGHEH